MSSTTTGIAPTTFLRHRIGVSLSFVMNGMLVGGWATSIPFFKDKHALAESELGLMILLIGVGSLMTMPLTGAVIARHGSTGILKLAACVCTFVLPLAILAPSIPLAIGALLLFGGALGSMDVSMNANAARVETLYAKPVMSSCHGFWSLGALIGAAIGGLLIGGFGLLGHAVGIATAMVVGVALALPRLMQDYVVQAEGTKKTKLTLPRSLTIYLIALIALAAFSAEGTVLDWAALYLREEHAVADWMASYAFAAFAGTMALVRFAGDPIRERLGDLRTFQISALLSTVGFLVAGLSPSLIGTLLGFAIAGLGLANLVPIAFAAAERVPGIPQGIGISIATFFGYAGLLVAPPLIGFAAEHYSYAIIFACVAVLPAYCLLVTNTVKRP